MGESRTVFIGFEGKSESGRMCQLGSSIVATLGEVEALAGVTLLAEGSRFLMSYFLCTSTRTNRSPRIAIPPFPIGPQSVAPFYNVVWPGRPRPA